MEVKRLVGLTYIIGGIIAFVIFDKFLLWIWPYLVEGINTAIRQGTGEAKQYLRNWAILGSYIRLTTVVSVAGASALTWYLYRPEEYRGYLSEVIIELKKVTWPDWDETRRSTLIVIVFTIALSGLLWVSDAVWEYLTGLLLSPGM